MTRVGEVTHISAVAGWTLGATAGTAGSGGSGGMVAPVKDGSTMAGFAGGTPVVTWAPPAATASEGTGENSDRTGLKRAGDSMLDSGGIAAGATERRGVMAPAPAAPPIVAEERMGLRRTRGGWWRAERSGVLAASSMSFSRRHVSAAQLAWEPGELDEFSETKMPKGKGIIMRANGNLPNADRGVIEARLHLGCLSAQALLGLSFRALRNREGRAQLLGLVA